MNNYYNHDGKFTPGTTVRSDAANAKFDGIETAFDKVETDINRSIKLPEGESIEITQTLTGRANTAIGFDEEGNIALLPGAGRWTGNYQASKLYTVRDIFRDAAGVVGLNNLYIVTRNFASTNLTADASNYELLISVADVEAAKVAAQAARDAAANSATQSANSATASSGSATSSANSATQAANSASFATTEANRATTEANRAKSEADRAFVAASSVDSTAFVTTTTTQTVGGSKTFSNPIIGSLNGNASTATTLQNSRTINGVSFNGSSNITITANTNQALTFGDGLSSSGTFNGGTARTVAVDSSVVRTSGTQSITGSKTFTSLIGGSISGDAATVGGIPPSQILKSIGDAVKSGGSLMFNDNTALIFGTGNSAKFFHNGVNLRLDLHDTSNHLVIRDTTTNRFTFARTTGDFTATGNITAFSDKRIKKNIEPITESLAKVLTLNGVTFDRTDIKTTRQTGIIAQEVQAVLPEAVTETDSGIMTVAYGNMVGLLIEAIKELTHKVNTLEARL